ncbi:hypothetical protein J2S90_003741 [Arthrobacter bambusae]|uniref:Secreted protein n=1 Tax=Arthrobacter bambusae TaxID=1338426 RepID=A0AAW8DIW4_9MICC|nr:hypothetical protein [Arthrobacter bambusae]MDQ0130949.1 hypothetical protein [Arthrobacter bambusae]MDQ0182471.1 hypothetical protein [Arthrobacter bambusae]
MFDGGPSWVRYGAWLAPAFGPALLCLLFPVSGSDLAERGRTRKRDPFYAGCRNTGLFGLVRQSPSAARSAKVIRKRA